MNSSENEWSYWQAELENFLIKVRRIKFCHPKTFTPCENSIYRAWNFYPFRTNGCWSLLPFNHRFCRCYRNINSYSREEHFLVFNVSIAKILRARFEFQYSNIRLTEVYTLNVNSLIKLYGVGLVFQEIINTKETMTFTLVIPDIM